MTKLATLCIDRQIAALKQLYYYTEGREYGQILSKIIDVANSQYTRRVMIAGVGKNSNIASKISETMASLGIPSFYLNVSHCGHGDFGFIGHNDVVIHISRSGTTREMMVAMEHIHLIRPLVYQALIHCKADKPVNSFANTELFIGAVQEGDEFGLAPTTSTTALLCVLDCLSVEASNAIGFKRLDFLKFHPDGALGDMLKAESKPVVEAGTITNAEARTATTQPEDTSPNISTAFLSELSAEDQAAIAELVDPVEVPKVEPVKELASAFDGLSAEDQAAIAGLVDSGIIAKSSF